FAVFDAVQRVGEAILHERVAGQLTIVRIIIREHDGNHLAVFGEVRVSVHALLACLGCATGNVAMNVEPWPVLLLAVMSPPWYNTILRVMASPMPVPSYSLRVCNRWKTLKMRSRYFSSNPMPLSATDN